MHTNPQIEIETRGGLFLPELDLWLDPHRKKENAFVSHAHADHFARHKRILCSLPTKSLVKARYGAPKSQITALEFGDEIESHGFRIRLVPAGHILGSAQIHLTRLSDGASLLYTGDFKTRPGLSSEAPESAKADTLIMETTFGTPNYVFPPIGDTVADILTFVRSAFEEGSTPVLLAYSLGKAQEALCALAGANVPVMLHKAVMEMTEVYATHGIEFPAYRAFVPGNMSGHVLIFPPNALRSAAIQDIEKRRTAMLSGWGIDPRAKYRYGVDEVFPMSDHADHPDLLKFVAQVRPKRVLTVHGYTAEFAAELRRRGIEAWSLEREDQLEFDLG